MKSPLHKIQVMYCGWGENWPLGTLASDGKHTIFEYSPEALRRGIEFSPRYLPLSTESYQDFPRYQFQLPGLFADSLPDGWGMLLMDRFFKKFYGREPHQVHPLERLAFLGERTLGAFAYIPATDADQSVEALTLHELADATVEIQRDKDTALLATLALMGGSPQGARPKSLVFYNQVSGQMSTQSFPNAEPWLVKFPAQNELPEVCAIEAAYLEVAQQCGFEVPDFQFLPINEQLSALAIKRFDRQGETRIPMHSLAGALHADFRMPNASYNIFLRMTRLMTKSEAEVYKAFARAAFNVCMNNRDDHTKNFSYVMTERGEWVLAPAYDLTFNTGLNGHHQMDIEGESLHLTREHLLALAKNAGLSAPKSAQILDEVVEVTANSSIVFEKYPIGAESKNLIVSTIRQNIALLKSQMKQYDNGH